MELRPDLVEKKRPGHIGYAAVLSADDKIERWISVTQEDIVSEED